MDSELRAILINVISLCRYTYDEDGSCNPNNEIIDIQYDISNYIEKSEQSEHE